ncbi:MAG: acetylxylan esterase, partial [Acidobacteriota bacterium]|nr:acetylxylan esterase [Acidobacteriota bacterium]
MEKVVVPIRKSSCCKSAAVAAILISELICVQPAIAQSTAVSAARLRPPIDITAEQDHQRTMNLLHISALRPAPVADAKAPNHANYDESKADAYSNYPDPLVLNNGRKVTSAKIWWTQRRPQIVEAFDREIYGRVPRHTPSVAWDVTAIKHDTGGGIPAVTRELIGRVNNSSYPLVTVNIRASLTIPARAIRPVPVIIDFGVDPAIMQRILAMLAKRGEKLPPMPAGPSWQQQVLSRGWGYAILIPTNYQDDTGAGLTKGIIGLCNKGQPRSL